MNITVSTAISVTASGRRTFVDLTSRLQRAVEMSGIFNGAAFTFCAHTTCSLTINEWEDGAHHDLHETLDELVPPDRYYRHDDLGVRTQNLQENEPANGHAHVAQMLVGDTSQMVPVIDGRLALGRWQRLMLLELDSPRPRSVHFTLLGSGAPRGVSEREECLPLSVAPGAPTYRLGG